MSEQLWATLRIKPALTESEPTPKWVSEHTRSGRIPMLWSGDPKDHGFNGPVVPVSLIETAELDALRAEVERLREALTAARNYIARDIDEILYSACLLDRVTGRPRRETIAPGSACFVEDAERIVAASDAALKGGEGV